MNPYNILGVSQDASEDEIKKAFKEQARKWHPDVNKDEGAEEKFKEVNEAYQTLTNKSNQHNFGGFESGGFGGFDIEDFFRKSQANTVRNVGYIAITLDEVMSGAQKAIDMTHNSPCGDCKGAGLKLSDKICPDCNGTGGTQVQRGIMTIMTQCNSCGATGKKIESICKSCNGSKTHTTIEKIDITIPIGSRHGSTIAIKDNTQFVMVNGPIKDIPTDWLSCAFQWYAVSVYNYVRLVGWLSKGNNSFIKEYIKRVIPKLTNYRHKVAAHFAFTAPQKNDNKADLIASIMTNIIYTHGFLRAGAISEIFTDNNGNLRQVMAY